MIHVRLPFADKIEMVKVREENLVKATSHRKTGRKTKSLRVIAEALKNPFGAEVEEFFKPGSNILFLVNDATRPTPTSLALKALKPMLRRVEPSFLVATGAHPPPTSPQLKKIFGNFLPKYEGKIRFNLALEGAFERLCHTRLGTEVRLNVEALKAGKVFIIGSVEPHYFAGYTGGRKSIMPGVASYASIEQNHRLALSLKAQPLALRGNPVHEDLEEAAEAYAEGRKIYSLLLVLNSERKVASAFAGSLDQTFEKATLEAEKLYTVDVEEKADIVLAVVSPPLDLNLYQAHKALEHGRLALKDGGIIILVAACPEGVGSREFHELLRSYRRPEEVLEAVRGRYRLGYHKAARIAELSLKAEIWAVTGLEGKLLREAFMKPYRSVQQALDEALKVKGKDARVLILQDAGLTVPRVQPGKR